MKSILVTGLFMVGSLMFTWALFDLFGAEQASVWAAITGIPLMFVLYMFAEWVNDKRQDAAMREGEFRQQDNLYVPLVEYLESLTGTQMSRPFSRTVSEQLDFMDLLSTSSAVRLFSERDKSRMTPFEAELAINQRRVDMIKRWLTYQDSIDEENRQLLKALEPEIAQAINTRILEQEEAREMERVLKSNARRTSQKADIAKELASMVESLAQETGMEPPLGESDQGFLESLLGPIQVPDWAYSIKQTRLKSDSYQDVEDSSRRSYFDIKIRFAVWKKALRDEDWETVGGPHSVLAKRAVLAVETEKLQQENLRKRIGEEKARDEYLQKRRESLATFLGGQLALHKRLLRITSHYRELTFGTRRSKWLLERKAPDPQPFGISAKGAELLVAEWLKYLGQINVEVTRYVGDGGIDVMTDELCVQVKNYDKSPVSSSETRDIFGTAVSEQRGACIFTSSSLSSDALFFAEKNDVVAVRYLVESGELQPLNSAGSKLLAAGEYGSDFDPSGGEE